ncbi:MAG: MoxR family ATPase, partial [Candidatus Competibacterales bacterium]
MSDSIPDLTTWRRRALGIDDTVNQVIVGQGAAVRLLVLAVFARGHALLEGDVGVGKTTLLR